MNKRGRKSGIPIKSKKDKLTHRLMTRLTGDEFQAHKDIAASKGLTPSAFNRELILSSIKQENLKMITNQPVWKILKKNTKPGNVYKREELISETHQERPDVSEETIRNNISWHMIESQSEKTQDYDKFFERAGRGLVRRITTEEDATVGECFFALIKEMETTARTGQPVSTDIVWSWTHELTNVALHLQKLERKNP